jgi:hypothetical protein
LNLKDKTGFKNVLRIRSKLKIETCMAIMFITSITYVNTCYWTSCHWPNHYVTCTWQLPLVWSRVVDVGSVLKSDNVKTEWQATEHVADVTISHEMEETKAEYSTLEKEQVTWSKNLVLSHIGDGH